jgi:hypothetical protein
LILVMKIQNIQMKKSDFILKSFEKLKFKFTLNNDKLILIP